MATLSTFRKGILIGGDGKPRLHSSESFLLRPPNLHPTLSFLYLINFLHHGEERSSGYSDICEKVTPTLIPTKIYHFINAINILSLFFEIPITCWTCFVKLAVFCKESLSLLSNPSIHPSIQLLFIVSLTYSFFFTGI